MLTQSLIPLMKRPSRRRITYSLFAHLPFSLLRRLAHTTLLVPYYHIVSDTDSRHVKHLYKYKSTREFKDDLDFLLKHYCPIDLLDALKYMDHGRPLPERAFLLTFDDGYRELSDVVAPILLAKGINATFFVNSAFTDNKELCYLNKASLIVEQCGKTWSAGLAEALSRIFHTTEFDEIRSAILSVTYQQRNLLDEIARIINVDFAAYLLAERPYLASSQIAKLLDSGFTVGAHSIDHPLYSSLSLEEQLHQTIESVKFVRERFQLSYGVFAFPHSDDHVSKEFFLRLSHSGLIDLSFGTAGLADDSAPRHLQRFSLERPIDKAERILAFQYAKRLKRLITMNPTIRRQ